MQNQRYFFDCTLLATTAVSLLLPKLFLFNAQPLTPPCQFPLKDDSELRVRPFLDRSFPIPKTDRRLHLV